MKYFLYLSALASIVAAQAPPPVPPETVVAKVEGKNITAADIEKMIAETPPQVGQAFRNDPASALTSVYLERYVAGEGDKLKLFEQSPWREQLEIARENILLTAMMRYVADHYEVTPDQTDAYYKQHASDYHQVTIKAIKINFKPEVKASAGDLEAAARSAFESAHAVTDRSEADARKIAEDVVKQARAGADFSQLVAKYAEGESKDFQGDYPPVKATSNYPEEIKKVVFAMRPGQISDPVRQSNCFYVIRVVAVTAQPLNEVREDIIHRIRTAHVADYVNDLRARFKPEIVRPDFFIRLNGAPPK